MLEGTQEQMLRKKADKMRSEADEKEKKKLESELKTMYKSYVSDMEGYSQKPKNLDYF